MTDFVAAEAGVRQMHARYANAVWRRDYATFGDCWTEDAEWRIAGLLHRGRADITAFIERALNDVDWVIMEFGAPILDVGDRTATARVHAREENALMKGFGIYYERLVETGGIWRRAWAMFELHYIERAGEPGRRLEHPDYGPPPGFPPMDAMPINYSKIHKY
jgi:hypothetical protein